MLQISGQSDNHFPVPRLRKLYHPNNAQLGMAIMRAGVTHWHAGLIEEGHGLICRAYAILLITHGAHHPITKDLEVKHQLHTTIYNHQMLQARMLLWRKSVSVGFCYKLIELLNYWPWWGRYKWKYWWWLLKYDVREIKALFLKGKCDFITGLKNFWKTCTVDSEGIMF